MVLKYIPIGVFIIFAFISVVYSSNMKTNEITLSEISKNISDVNNILQDLMTKYTLLKTASQVKGKTSHKKEKKFNKFYNEKTDFETRAKVKIKDSEKISGTTLFFTDQSGEDSGNDVSEKEIVSENITVKDNKRFTDLSIKIGNPREFEGIGTFISDQSSENEKYKINYQAQNKNKVFHLDDEISADLQENTFKTKYSREETQKQINAHEQNLKNKKITTSKDNSSDKVIKSKSKDTMEPKDVHKILVIHLGGKEYLENNRVSSLKNVVTRTTKKQQIPTRSIAFRSVTADDTISDLEGETAMKEYILRANSLREALGDACTTLVNKKCKNALKAVLKDVCKKDRKCKKDFNNDFTENSISACDEQFSNNKKRKLNKKRSDHDKHFRVDNYSDDDDDDENSKSDDENLTGVQFIDYTRQGIDVTCLHALSGVKEAKTAERTNLTKIDTKTKNVHILRDKLEDACRKSCFDKCNKACKSATDKTCKKHECISPKKKALAKSCKKRCKESYQYEGKSSSGSKSDSDSDEDSDKDDSD